MFQIKENKVVAKNVFWNTVGSLFYLLCQWLLTVVVVRLSKSYEDAGILSLAMSLTNIFTTIALFNVRNYQASDVEGKYTSSEYYTHRILTCGLALILCTVFVLLNSYNIYISLSIIGYMIVKLVESYADVLHGMAQNKWRLDIAGKSYIARGALLIGSFTVCELLFKNLAISIAVMALTNLLVIFIYDFPAVKKLEPFSFTFNRKKIINLSLTCLPLLLYGICTNSIASFARYYLELIHGEEVLGYYSTASSLAVLVQAFVTLIFTPLIGVFTEHYKNDDRKAIAKLLLMLCGLLVAITAIAALVIFLLGDFAMSLLFGEEILPYVYLLYPSVFASCLMAFMWLLGMLLVIIRDSLTLVLGSVLGILTSMIICILSIPDTVYKGTNAAILIGLSAVALIYLIKIIFWLLSPRKTNVLQQHST